MYCNTFVPTNKLHSSCSMTITSTNIIFEDSKGQKVSIPSNDWYSIEKNRKIAHNARVEKRIPLWQNQEYGLVDQSSVNMEFGYRPIYDQFDKCLIPEDQEIGELHFD